MHQTLEMDSSSPPPPPLTSENHQSHMGPLMLTTCTPLTLKFVDVSYKVKVDSTTTTTKKMCSGDVATLEEKTILNGITGMVSPGEVLAVLGPSGSGKSTLLNVLAGRLQGKHSGEVTANGRQLSKSTTRNIGFVTQDDVLYPHLTVKETLVFCSLLRLPKTLSRKEKVGVAESVITELGLGKCQDTIVGNGFVRGVSGGERKRVSIGHEILVNPSLLLLDEPTSGLDSTGANRLVSVLVGLAKKLGKTIVASVHQPSSQVFQMFDSVLLMSEGSCLYFGKGGDAMNYFSSIGFSPLFPVNPADFLLDLANGVARVEGQMDMDKSNLKQTLLFSYNQFIAPEVRACINNKTISEATNQIGKRHQNEQQQSKNFSSISWFSQFTILLIRSLKERRHEAFNTLRVFQVIAASILAGTMWWQSSMSDIQDRLGLLFFIAIFWGVFPATNAVFAFPQERAIFIKERSSRMYSLSSYFMARMVGDLPMELILPTIFITITYFMAALRPAVGAFILTLAILLGYVLTAQGLGLMFGATIMDAKKASTLVTVIMLAFLLTGGFYVHKVPAWLAWLKYTSLTFYCFQLLIKVQYCYKEPCFLTNLPHTNSQNNTELVEHGLEGQEGTMLCVGALILMFFGYRLLAYAALKRIKV